MTDLPAAGGADRVLRAIGDRLHGRPLAIMLDVDGTLAPIVERFQDAAVPGETRRVVAALAALDGVHVVLVSGRAAQDAARMVGVPSAWALGNHGMELLSPDGALHPDAAVLPFEKQVASVARELEALAAGTAGAALEDKRWTLSLHYRRVRESEIPALVESARRLVQRTALRLTEGKKIVEVRPPVDVHKGTATVALARRLGALSAGGAVCFAGDDRTDEDAFEALRAESANAVTIRIGPVTDPTAAEFRVESPEEFRAVLEGLARRAGAVR